MYIFPPELKLYMFVRSATFIGQKVSKRIKRVAFYCFTFQFFIWFSQTPPPPILKNIHLCTSINFKLNGTFFFKKKVFYGIAPFCKTEKQKLSTFFDGIRPPLEVMTSCACLDLMALEQLPRRRRRSLTRSRRG